MFTNKLINESSPYLLQHAHNPVHWHAWNDEAWTKAREENKLVLISIGYSSCHWCHVMERESFEDVSTAELMNRNFVCIKVDREERPDVDHVYMSAVQLMTGQGGWPLNCICLPDGKPVYGGTYFPNAQWKNVLSQLHTFYSANPEQARNYADELTQGVAQMEMVTLNPGEMRFTRDDLKAMLENWKKHFDHTEGGPNRAPKFPMPNNYEFLLHYAVREKDDSLLNYVLLTLDKMAFGGIYDQLGGGFARYSTDARWKAPHFEKMLYDNAQLVSLYSHAWQLTGKERYKNVVNETLGFVEREMTSPEGGFYSALDADSEGVEGKYYVWTKEELAALLPEGSFDVFCDYYNVNETGYWEHAYILLRKEEDEKVAGKHLLAVDELKRIITDAKSVLLKAREKRIRPGLDDKQLTSWNALMIHAYCDAFDAFGEEKFLQTALHAAELIRDKGKRKDGGLKHSGKNGKYGINGYLEDYSFFIEALIRLYECTGNEDWLEEARQLTDYAIAHFYDSETGLFYFTSKLDPPLIARKKEIHDNVIPASNSSMAKALFRLGKFYEEGPYNEMFQRMLHQVKEDLPRYGSSFSNWAQLLLWIVNPYYEIVITGSESQELSREFARKFLPDKILAFSGTGNSGLSLFRNRYVESKTLIYVCRNNSCLLPFENVGEALKLMKT